MGQAVYANLSSDVAELKGPLCDTRAGIMDENSLEYFRGRERIEREAASSATCDTARLAHEQLANRYASLVRQGRRSAGRTLSGLWSNVGRSAENIDVAMRRHNAWRL